LCAVCDVHLVSEHLSRRTRYEVAHGLAIWRQGTSHETIYLDQGLVGTKITKVGRRGDIITTVGLPLGREEILM